MNFPYYCNTIYLIIIMMSFYQERAWNYTVYDVAIYLNGGNVEHIAHVGFIQLIQPVWLMVMYLIFRDVLISICIAMAGHMFYLRSNLLNNGISHSME